MDCFGGGFEEVFFELAPETAEHEFVGEFASWIFLDYTGVKYDAFPLFVLTDIVILGDQQLYVFLICT